MFPLILICFLQRKVINSGMPHPHFVSPANAMVACPCRIVILDSFWHPADNERRVVAAVAVVVVRSFFHSQARKKRGGRTDGLLLGMGNIEGVGWGRSFTYDVHTFSESFDPLTLCPLSANVGYFLFPLPLLCRRHICMLPRRRRRQHSRFS